MSGIIDAAAQSQHVLSYRTPAADDLDQHDRYNKQTYGNIKFVQEALPLGNGRLGAMFTGGIRRERFAFNEITLWTDTHRGLDPIQQSGSKQGAWKALEHVRKVYRSGAYGQGPNSMEGVCGRYLISKHPVGNYAPFTEVFIETGHRKTDVSDYRRELDIRKGLASVSYRRGETKYLREYFCSHPDDLFVMRYTSTKSDMSLTIRTYTAHKEKTLKVKERSIFLYGKAPLLNDDAVDFLQILTIDAGKAKVSANEDGSLKVENASDVKIYIAAYTDYTSVYPHFKGRGFASDCAKTIHKARNAGYNVLKKRHTNDMTAMMDRCRLDLESEAFKGPVPELLKHGLLPSLSELFFNYTRYLVLASSRSAPLPSNLQGIWNTHFRPMWNSDYHHDINVAMNYWMVETANLSESFTPYLKYMKVIAQSGAYTAKTHFGIQRGWSAGLNSNAYGLTAPVESGRRMQQSGAWLCQNLYDHFSFNRDLAYLEKIYPIIKGAAAFYLDFLSPWKDGSLVIYPTWSPENYYMDKEYGKLNKQTWGASWDQQIVYNLFSDCIEAAHLLNRDEAFRAELEQAIPRLCPQKIGRHGQLQEWPEDWDDPANTHRHISHLIGLHPGRDISPFTTPEMAAAGRVTLEHRGDESTGWSTGWKVNFWARQFKGDRAYRQFRFLLTERIYPNLLTFHPPFQIDGSFGSVAGICEMLLQSHLRSVDAEAKTIETAAFQAYRRDAVQPGHYIPVVPPKALSKAPYILHLLPALPSVWPDGKAFGLRARGGFEVDLEWKKGRLRQAMIRSVNGGVFRLYANGVLSNEITLEKGKNYNWKGD